MCDTKPPSPIPSTIGTTAAAPPASAAPPPPPSSSLVPNGQSGTNSFSSPWSRQQKRIFQRLTSWCFEAVGCGCQLLRVDLTTDTKRGNGDQLRHDLKRLRRRVESQLGFKGLELFTVETTEGGGVLHMVWAWQGKRSFYIPQAWLSAEWSRLHGAPVVWVRQMEVARGSIRRVARYFAVQYLADQRGALVRMSWSWWRSRIALAKGWEALKRLASETYRDDHRRRWVRVYVRPMCEVVAAWEALLRDGHAMLGETLLRIEGRDLVEAF